MKEPMLEGADDGHSLHEKHEPWQRMRLCPQASLSFEGSFLRNTDVNVFPAFVQRFPEAVKKLGFDRARGLLECQNWVLVLAVFLNDGDRSLKARPQHYILDTIYYVLYTILYTIYDLLCAAYYTRYYAFIMHTIYTHTANYSRKTILYTLTYYMLL